LDILLFEMILVCCWYNPFVWFMRRAIRQNLEFLTDQQVLNKGIDKQTYQYSLLNVSKKGTSIGLSNQFNFKLLKRRIMMMNKKRSSKIELSKYAFLLPIFLLTGAAFTVSKAEGSIEGVVEKANETTLLKLDDQQRDSTLSVKMVGEAGKLLEEVMGTDTVKIDTNRPKNTTDLLSYKIGSLEIKGGVDPLIVLNGTISSKEQLKSITPEEIESTAILRDKGAVAIYGERAKDGVVLITTKKGNVNGKSEKELKGKVTGFMVKQDSVGTTKSHTIKYPVDVLYVIDGVKVGSEDMKDVDPNNIESIHVIKDSPAMVKYGREGKNGVIEVTTKKWAKENPDKVSKVAKELKSENKVGESLPALYYKQDEDKQGAKVVTFEGKSKTDVKETELKGRAQGIVTNMNGLASGGPGKYGAFSNGIKGDPLVVLDGEVMGKTFGLNKINSNDIESFTILKDQSASALYGDQGKDGVFIITTKAHAKAHPEAVPSSIEDRLSGKVKKVIKAEMEKEKGEAAKEK